MVYFLLLLLLVVVQPFPEPVIVLTELLVVSHVHWLLDWLLLLEVAGGLIVPSWFRMNRLKASGSPSSVTSCKNPGASEEPLCSSDTSSNIGGAGSLDTLGSMDALACMTEISSLTISSSPCPIITVEDITCLTCPGTCLCWSCL